MSLNNWSVAEVNRAESTWGQKVPAYSKDMFDFLILGLDSWLDLGCGFGRFIKYLDSKVSFPDYVGYDSSEPMVERVKANFPDQASRIFLRSITDPIEHDQEGILISAVLIHLPRADQDRILVNLLSLKNTKKITFDINSPCEKELVQRPYFEKIIKGSEHTFRMTWQSHYAFTRKVISLFENRYHVLLKMYPLQQHRHKVVYFLERRAS